MDAISRNVLTSRLLGSAILLVAYCSMGFPAANADVVRVVPVDVVPYALSAIDLDDDGLLELLVGGLDQDAICAVNQSGKRLWRYPTAGMPLAIRTGDVDGDGQNEIVAIVGTSASKIIVLGRDGSLRREIQPDAVVYLLQLADLSADGKLDIIVAGYLGKILAYDGQGRKILDKTVVTKNFYRRMVGLAAGDLDGDGRAEIAYHGSMHQPGVIDAAGQGVRRGVWPSLTGGLAAAADINRDGKSELLLASLGQIRAESLSRKLWTASLSENPGQLAAAADGIRKHPWEYGGWRFLAAGNLSPDAGLEIASFASDGKFNVLSSDGKSLLRTKTKYPLHAIAAADLDADGFDEILLGRLHYKKVYVVSLRGGVAAAESAVLQIADNDHVTEGLDRMLSQIETLRSRRVRARSHDEKLHVLWGMEGTVAPPLLGKAIRVIDAEMRRRRCENVEYAFMFTLKERGVRQFKRDGICAVGPLAVSGETLLDRCRQWEEMGIRFYPVISHVGVPTVMPETAKKIMEVAPNACQGYLTWETMCNYPSEVWYDFLRRMDELAQICVKKNKKILFAEEAPFWIALVSDPKARQILLKPEYKGVLVPVLKTLMPQGDEADISAYVGSMLAGEIETWGITSEEDFWPHELGYYRGCPDDVVMRQDMMAVALGARYIMVESGHLYFEPADNRGRYNLLMPTRARISREARREHTAVELFRKGILGPVAAEDLLSVSPVGLVMSRGETIARAPIRWKAYGTRTFQGTGLLNMDMTTILLNSGPNSLARNLYGSKKLMNGVFPNTPWGIVPIYGREPAQTGTRPGTVLFDTDGSRVTAGFAELSAAEGIKEIASAARTAAARLPFTAADVFISARRDGDDRYQVILMDAEMFAPADIQTTVATAISGLACYDELTGESLAMQGNRVPVTVPAGGWRILRFER